MMEGVVTLVEGVGLEICMNGTLSSIVVKMTATNI